jgi:hypothetical protein
MEYIGQNTKRLLFLETCVSYGSREEVNLIAESQTDPTQAFSGKGSRPTRPWVFRQLQNHFEYVYIPKTQPNDKQFPLDWTVENNEQDQLNRAVFIASRDKLENDLLVPFLIDRQIRHA